MKKDTLWLVLAALAAVFTLLAGPALADGIQPYQLGFQEAVTPVAERIHIFHNMMLWIISGITVFVMILLLIVMVRFNARANPVPSSTTHNVPLEIVWTVVPVLILIIIAVPSLKLLYFTDRVVDPEMTLKVTGNQWNWTYEYPDYEGLSFTSVMIPTNELDTSKGQKRLLSVDNPIVLPVDTTVQIVVTASDVLHSFAMPAFGVKVDAVPGRLNETWARITKPGTYYGQCSELCGKDHAFMPIEVRAVSKEDFQAWAEAAKTNFINYDAFLAQRGSTASVNQ
jgi:cytochrome c oxidase subunit 2